MTQLFLSEPKWSDIGDCTAANQRRSHLQKLESIIRSLITSEVRSEARMWLCNTISCLSSVTAQAQCEIFVNLLRSRPNSTLAAQLLQMVFEKRPHKVGPIIAKKNHVLEKFFKGNPGRILQWFGNFAGVGESQHRKGARAISQFAFVNRDICWEELEWMGKHGQSPAVVATKPHYFLDLDVQRTVENFLENVPEFWSSDELAESIKDGEILHIDKKFFVEYFLDLMYEKESKEVWELIRKFLTEESFTFLCHHILLILKERDFCAFLDLLCKFIIPRMESKCFGHVSYWLETLLSMHKGYSSLDDLLLLNAVINQGRQLLRLIRDEEHEEQKQKLAELVLEISNNPDVGNAALMRECMNEKKKDSVKWIALQSWLLHYQLSEECQTPESWKTVFIKNGISFRQSTSYDLLHIDMISESNSDLDDRGSVRSKRRKKGKSRKKRRRRDYCRSDDNELVDSEDLQLRDRSWLLSIDDYSSTWNSIDLPEHLAKHCFSTWLKWLCSKWSSLG